MNQKEKNKRTGRVIVAVGAVLAIFVLCGFGVLVGYFTYTQTMDLEYYAYAESVANLVLGCIEPDDMTYYLTEAEQYDYDFFSEDNTEADWDAYLTYLADNVKDEKYYTSEAEIEKILYGMERVAYIYISQVREDYQYMILDIDTPEFDGYELGELVIYEEYFLDSLPALLAHETIGPLYSTDKFGSLLTAYFPFFDVNGAYAGHIGVDLDMKSVLAEREAFVWTIGGFMSLIAGGTSLAAVVLLLRIMKRNAALKDQLIIAADNAEAASKSKSDFLAKMSHEIRTPMNAVIGLTALSKKNIEDTEKVMQYLTKTEYSSKLLLSLINDILDMSAIENNKMKIAHEPFDMSKILTVLSSVYYDQCQTKGIDFDCQVPRGYHSQLIGDQLRVNQVLLNLLSNAVKFTPSGGKIRLMVDETPLQDDRVMHRFTVSDTGCGMSEEVLSRVFQPFEQASSTTAQKYGGTGLGMSIAKNLTELMGGSISVASQVDVGTTFTVDVPFDVSHEEVMTFEKSDSEKISMLNITAEEEKTYDFKRKRILVVEDNALNCEIAVAQLEAVNCEVEKAEDGKIALDMFVSHDADYYDLILMDVQMPNMNGYEATKAIRASAKADAERVIIIAMTANAFVEDAAEAKASGMNAHLTKPIEPNELYETLQGYLFAKEGAK